MPAQDVAFRALIGRSEAIQEALAIAYRVARSPIRMVLLEGETGTGKELFARGIHASGANASEPFVTVNCAAIPASLLESELFGHERGAFTGATTRKSGLLEVARSGTVLLDEIAELSLALQAKLLRVLEERVARRVGGVDELPIRCRVIAATNESLEAAVGRGAFREDLYYRLNAFRLTLPPLRDRLSDVEVLAHHFLQEIAVDQKLTPVSISADACAMLRAHEWRGNVRELKHVIERAAVVCDGPEVQPHHIVLHRRNPTRAGAAPASVNGAAEIRIPRTGLTMDEIEREAIRITLEHTGGNQTVAARTLGISRATLLRKLEKFGLKDSASTVVVA